MSTIAGHWMSACGGVGSPLGWLCTGMMAVADTQRPLDHLARIDRCVVYGADLLHFVGDQLVAFVGKDQMLNSLSANAGWSQ